MGPGRVRGGTYGGEMTEPIEPGAPVVSLDHLARMFQQIDGEGASDADAVELREIALGFRRLLMTYRFGLDEMMTKVTILREEFRHIHDYTPIEHIGSRMKSFESILAKANRRGIPLRPDAVRDSLTDIAGIRITCSFVTDIYRMRDLLIGQRDVTLLQEKDYIAQPKGNGYKSLHLILSVPVYLSDRIEQVVVEVQLRTIAMDFWASLEHKIYYKYDREIPPHLTAALAAAATEAATLDATMQRIHSEVQELARGDDASGGGGGSGAPVRAGAPIIATIVEPPSDLGHHAVAL